MGRGGEEAATKDEEEGWYDDDGFWFEPAADGSAGFYDCYDPEGQLHETGSYTDAGEWVKAEAFAEPDAMDVLATLELSTQWAAAKAELDAHVETMVVGAVVAVTFSNEETSISEGMVGEIVADGYGR